MFGGDRVLRTTTVCRGAYSSSYTFFALAALYYKGEQNKGHVTRFLKLVVTTLQEENFYWNLNFAISLNQTSLNLNSTNNLNYVDFSMLAYRLQENL